MIYVNDSSRVWHVAKAGNDGNSGHAEQYPVNLANDAKLTIGVAVTAAASGDTIIVWPGTYDEAIDLDAANKVLTITGTNRALCVIYNQTGGGHGIVLEDDCVLSNISVLSGTGNGAAGLKAQKNRLTIDNVYAKCNSVSGAVDGAQFNNANDLHVNNSIFTGDYDGAVITGCNRALFDNCHFITTGASSNEVKGLIIGQAIYNVQFRNCVFQATRSADIDLQIYGAWVQGSPVFRDCSFYAKTSLSCNANATALRASGGSFVNCGFYASATAGSTAYEIDGYSAGPVLLACSGIGGTPVINGTVKIIDRKFTLDSAGRVDVGMIKGVDGDAAIKAIKVLKNKAVQDKLTGAIRYYDDDGATIILTHTPDEDDASFTRTVS